MKPKIKKQITIFLVIAIVVLLALIIYGTYAGLECTQISKLKIQGIILTFIIIFPLMILIEKILKKSKKAK